MSYQREIKFRAWDLDNKRWCDTYIVVGSGSIGQVEVTGGRNAVIMQYTGIKDKYWKEIYEGDIVKYPEWDDDNVPVEWNEDASRFEFANGEYFDDVEFNQIRVIGNIYENPGLLEEGNNV